MAAAGSPGRTQDPPAGPSQGDSCSIGGDGGDGPSNAELDASVQRLQDVLEGEVIYGEDVIMTEEQKRANPSAFQQFVADAVEIGFNGHAIIQQPSEPRETFAHLNLEEATILEPDTPAFCSVNVVIPYNALRGERNDATSCSILGRNIQPSGRLNGHQSYLISGQAPERFFRPNQSCPAAIWEDMIVRENPGGTMMQSNQGSPVRIGGTMMQNNQGSPVRIGGTIMQSNQGSPVRIGGTMMQNNEVTPVRIGGTMMQNNEVTPVRIGGTMMQNNQVTPPQNWPFNDPELSPIPFGGSPMGNGQGGPFVSSPAMENQNAFQFPGPAPNIDETFVATGMPGWNEAPRYPKGTYQHEPDILWKQNLLKKVEKVEGRNKKGELVQREKKIINPRYPAPYNWLPIRNPKFPFPDNFKPIVTPGYVYPWCMKPIISPDLPFPFKFMPTDMLLVPRFAERLREAIEERDRIKGMESYGIAVDEEEVPVYDPEVDALEREEDQQDADGMYDHSGQKYFDLNDYNMFMDDYTFDEPGLDEPDMVILQDENPIPMLPDAKLPLSFLRRTVKGLNDYQGDLRGPIIDYNRTPPLPNYGPNLPNKSELRRMMNGSTPVSRQYYHFLPDPEPRSGQLRDDSFGGLDLRHTGPANGPMYPVGVLREGLIQGTYMNVEEPYQEQDQNNDSFCGMDIRHQGPIPAGQGPVSPNGSGLNGSGLNGSGLNESGNQSGIFNVSNVQLQSDSDRGSRSPSPGPGGGQGWVSPNRGMNAGGNVSGESCGILNASGGQLPNGSFGSTSRSSSPGPYNGGGQGWVSPTGGSGNQSGILDESNLQLQSDSDRGSRSPSPGPSPSRIVPGQGQVSPNRMMNASGNQNGESCGILNASGGQLPNNSFGSTSRSSSPGPYNGGGQGWVSPTGGSGNQSGILDESNLQLQSDSDRGSRSPSPGPSPSRIVPGQGQVSPNRMMNASGNQNGESCGILNASGGQLPNNSFGSTSRSSSPGPNDGSYNGGGLGWVSPNRGTNPSWNQSGESSTSGLLDLSGGELNGSFGFRGGAGQFGQPVYQARSPPNLNIVQNYASPYQGSVNGGQGPMNGSVNGGQGSMNGSVNGGQGSMNGSVNGGQGSMNGSVNGGQGSMNGSVNGGQGSLNGSCNQGGQLNQSGGQLNQSSRSQSRPPSPGPYNGAFVPGPNFALNDSRNSHEDPALLDDAAAWLNNEMQNANANANQSGHGEQFPQGLQSLNISRTTQNSALSTGYQIGPTNPIARTNLSTPSSGNSWEGRISPTGMNDINALCENAIKARNYQHHPLPPSPNVSWPEHLLNLSLQSAYDQGAGSSPGPGPPPIANVSLRDNLLNLSLQNAYAEGVRSRSPSPRPGQGNQLMNRSATESELGEFNRLIQWAQSSPISQGQNGMQNMSGGGPAPSYLSPRLRALSPAPLNLQPNGNATLDTSNPWNFSDSLSPHANLSLQSGRSRSPSPGPHGQSIGIGNIDSSALASFEAEYLEVMNSSGKPPVPVSPQTVEALQRRVGQGPTQQVLNHIADGTQPPSPVGFSSAGSSLVHNAGNQPFITPDGSFHESSQRMVSTPVANNLVKDEFQAKLNNLAYKSFCNIACKINDELPAMWESLAEAKVQETVRAKVLDEEVREVCKDLFFRGFEEMAANTLESSLRVLMGAGTFDVVLDFMHDGKFTCAAPCTCPILEGEGNPINRSLNQSRNSSGGGRTCGSSRRCPNTSGMSRTNAMNERVNGDDWDRVINQESQKRRRILARAQARLGRQRSQKGSRPRTKGRSKSKGLGRKSSCSVQISCEDGGLIIRSASRNGRPGKAIRIECNDNEVDVMDADGRSLSPASDWDRDRSASPSPGRRNRTACSLDRNTTF